MNKRMKKKNQRKMKIVKANIGGGMSFSSNYNVCCRLISSYVKKSYGCEVILSDPKKDCIN